MSKQTVYNILASAKKEPIKVEFVSADLTQLIAGIKSQTGNLQRAADSSVKYFSDLELLKSKASEQVSVNNKIIQNAESLISDSQKAKQNLRSKADELGVNVNDIPVYAELIKFEQGINSNISKAKEANFKLFSSL